MEALKQRGRPKTAQGRLIQIRLTEQLERALDFYRGQLSPIPSRNAVILDLISAGLFNTSTHVETGRQVRI